MQHPEYDEFVYNGINGVVGWNNRVGNISEHRDISHPSVIGYRNLIEEEYQELFDAYEANDRKEVVDAAFDILVVTTGLLHMMGYNTMAVMDVGNLSNFSKFVNPNNPKEVEESVAAYADDDRYSDVYVDDNGVVWGTVNATGSKKVLKGIHYRPPQWYQLDPELEE